MISKDYIYSAPHKDLTKFLHQVLQSDGPNTYYNIAKNVQEPGQELAGALKGFHEKHNILTQPQQHCCYDPEEFNTMCHGDMWFNNMLFK
jgi:thiamine kinase-like enzyme